MARYKFSREFQDYFIKVCQGSGSMSQAALQLGMNYKTLCFHAKRLSCFAPNQCGKGTKKAPSKKPSPLEEILNGKKLTYQSNKLKIRILKEKVRSHRCEHCGLKMWQGRKIPLELHHRDGNKYNNKLDNLMLLCPNCHALTDNYRARNIRNLSAPVEIREVEPLKFGETSSNAGGNPEPNFSRLLKEGVET
ncbi:MAG: HNH endonuclease signature motif containing protein [Flavisolibacter sp.]